MKTYEITITSTYSITVEDDVEIEDIVSEAKEGEKNGIEALEEVLDNYREEYGLEYEISDPYDTEFDVLW